MTLPQNLRQTRTGWSIRVRIGAAGRPWLPMPEMSETDALSRLERVQALAEEFVRAKKPHDAERALRTCAEQETAKAFDVAVRAAKRRLTELGGELTGPKTFRDVAELWIDGTLARRYPDESRYRIEGKHLARVRKILAIIDPVIGKTPVTLVTLEQADQARAAIPPSVKVTGSRRHYSLVIRRVLALAVYPLALLPVSPIPPGWVPAQGKPPAFGYLYPDEERALIACAEVPFIYRLLFGFLARNGCRVSEALGLSRSDVDLETGLLTLDENKTDDPRQWTLAPDVVRALERHLRASSAEALFPDIDGRHIADKLRAFLAQAGVTRAQLFSRTAARRPLRCHDLRATFITLALASGRTETWVMDRTGHKSSQMVNLYRRAARTAEEANLGWLHPLDECLWAASGPRVRRAKGGPKVDQTRSIEPKWAAMGSTRGTSRRAVESADSVISAAASRSNTTGQRLGPPQTGGVDQRLEAGVTAVVTSPGLSEATLRRLLELATRSREWGAVRELSAALETLAAQEAPNVTRLDDRRRK